MIQVGFEGCRSTHSTGIETCVLCMRASAARFATVDSDAMAHAASFRLPLLPAGDVLAVLPEQSDAHITSLLTRLDLNGDQWVCVTPSPDSPGGTQAAGAVQCVATIRLLVKVSMRGSAQARTCVCCTAVWRDCTKGEICIFKR